MTVWMKAPRVLKLLILGDRISHPDRGRATVGAALAGGWLGVQALAVLDAEWCVFLGIFGVAQALEGSVGAGGAAVAGGIKPVLFQRQEGLLWRRGIGCAGGGCAGGGGAVYGGSIYGVHMYVFILSD